MNYEIVRKGCATSDPNCPHGAEAVTAYELRPDGRRKFDSLTVCVDRRKP